MLKIHTVEIFTHNSAAHHIWKTFRNVVWVMFRISMVIHRFNSLMVAGGVAKIFFLNAPIGKNPMGLGPCFVGAVAQWKRVCHWKIRVKIPWFVLTDGQELCSVESKCIANLHSVMRMKIMLNNEDTLRSRQHRENFAWNFFWTCDTKIVMKFQHRHKIRLGLKHSIPKICKIAPEWANLHWPMVLARCVHIYPGLRVSLYILYKRTIQ